MSTGIRRLFRIQDSGSRRPYSQRDIHDRFGCIENECSWPAARGIVDGLPRSGFGKKAAGYWGPELYTMRKDLRPLRLALVGGKADVENYNLVRFVYRYAISNRRFDHIKECLAKAADLEIFLLCRQLESRRVLPGMDDGLGGHVHRHEDISDLIAR